MRVRATSICEEREGEGVGEREGVSWDASLLVLASKGCLT